MSKRSRRKAKVQRQHEGGCPTCGHLRHVRPRRGGRVRSVMPRWQMRPMPGHRGWRMPVNDPRGTPRPSMRLARWERHQPAHKWLGHCPDPWHVKLSDPLRGHRKRRR